MDELVISLSSIALHSQDAFMNEQSNLLEETKPLLRACKQQNKELCDELIEQMIPMFSHLESLILRKTHIRHMTKILSKDELTEFQNMLSFVVFVDKRAGEAKRVHDEYHRNVIVCRLRYMMRKCSKKEWKKALLPIHHAYEAYCVDVCEMTRLRNAVVVWLNELDSNVDYNTFMWGYRIVYYTLQQTNTRIHSLHQAHTQRYQLLNDKWEFIEVDRTFDLDTLQY